ncbi:MAG TPA: hypothetical protein VHB18_07905 [Mycobacteriales bacterium]|jgi:hypothetical protein|nr:hypothetical protein [Mycobacteriales bacterium]
MVAVAKEDLVALYESLLAATPSGEDPPGELLESAAAVAGSADPAIVESLPPRARVVMRLLRHGHATPAWAALIDGATGIVKHDFRATTSSGASRTDWPLPILTAVESPDVFAQFPGFRDPRYGVPDEIYEVGAAIKLRCHVDDVIAGKRPVLAGWAALDVLDTEPTESVVVVARHEGVEISWPGSRQRRPDQVGGSRDTLRRRAWSGWRVAIDPSDLSAAGRWTLWLAIGQRGFSRRARIGKSAGDLAERAVGHPLSRKPPVSLVQGNGGWSLLVAAQRRR